MPTIQDLAIEYATYLRLNRNNPHAASEIASRISGLTYTSSGKELSAEAKRELIDSIGNALRHKQSEDGGLIVEADDLTALLAMVDKIKAMVKR